jgi:hypothetical protein
MPTDDSLDFYANKFNKLFRDASVKDDKRPAVVGALMLALWWVQTEGARLLKLQREKPLPAIRRADELIIGDAADFCVQAFKNAGSRQEAMGKVLSNTLKSLVSADTSTGEDTKKSIEAVRIILHDLEKLGVGQTQLSADFLGQLYERFFQYTGAWRACAVDLWCFLFQHPFVYALLELPLTRALPACTCRRQHHRPVLHAALADHAHGAAGAGEADRHGAGSVRGHRRLSHRRRVRGAGGRETIRKSHDLAAGYRPGEEQAVRLRGGAADCCAVRRQHGASLCAHALHRNSTRIACSTCV